MAPKKKKTLPKKKVAKKKASKPVKKKVKKPEISDEVYERVSNLTEQLVAAEAARDTARDDLAAAGAKNEELLREIERLKTDQPPKLTPKRVKTATDAVLLSLLLDAKSVLIQDMTNQAAAAVMLRINQLEMNMPAITLAETILVQKAKALSAKFQQGLEVDQQDLADFFKMVRELTRT